MSTFEELMDKYCQMVFTTTRKLHYEAACAEMDYHFYEGDITQREWAKLYQIICYW